MSSPITVEPDAVEGLAAELAALAAELDDEAALCRSTAASLDAALGGHEGWTAGAAGSAWAVLAQRVADRGSAVATTLVAAMSAYRAADATFSAQIDSAQSETGAPADGSGHR
jgi:hypothetical protein